MRTVVFVNAHSRRASRYLSAVRKFFDTQHRFDIIDYIVVEDLKDFDSYLARLKRSKNIACVIVGGGDGTVMTVLNALKDRTDIIYGFLPLGTTNVFARNLGLSLNPKKALRTLPAQQTRRVNLGSVNGVLFLNVADVGLSVQVVKRLHNRSKRRLGPLAYYLLSMRLLPRAQRLQCELQIGHDVITLNTFDLAIINGRYYGPLTITKDGSVYNDRFTILYGTDSRRLGFVRDTHSFVLGRQYKRRNVFMISAPHLTLRTPHPEDIQADGEVIGKTPAEIKIVKDAIRVLAPPEQGSSRKNHR